MSNKYALVIVALLAIAVLGVAVTFRISPTAMATGESWVTVSVAGTAAISVIHNHINLSNNNDTAGNPGAYVATNASSATINSFDNLSNENWLNATGGAPRKIWPSNITINNTGTVVELITLSSGTTPTALFGAAGGDFWFNMTNGSNTGLGCNGASAQGWTQYSTNTTTVCGKLGHIDTADTLSIWAKWQIPAGVAAATYNSTLTISATQAT